MAEVTLSGVSKSFRDVTAVSDMRMTIPDGAFVVLLGPTGAGKTTTLRLIAGLETPESGTITIGGHDVTVDTPSQRDVAMVFQQYSLYPHLTVRQNLAFPLKSPLRSHPEAEIERIVAQTARMLQISHKLDNAATTLSGGEMQRVSIGRALVRQPAIYLMDEPLSSLDARLRSELRMELKRIQAELGATMLYVTHDQIEAMTMATHVGVLEAGRLVQFGSPRQVYSDPDSVYVATRLGQPRINIAPVAIFGDLPAPRGTTHVGLRPEHIDIGPANGSARTARVGRVEHLGDQTRLHLDLRGTGIVTLTDPHSGIEPGQDVSVATVDPLFFDAGGQRLREAGTAP